MPSHILDNPTLREVLDEAVNSGLLEKILLDQAAEGYIAFPQYIWNICNADMKKLTKQTIKTYLNELLTRLNVDLDSRVLINYPTMTWQEEQEAKGE